MADLLDQTEVRSGVPPISVLVVDDHDLFRKGLRRLLEADGLNVVGDERSGDLAVRSTARLEPRVVVMDVSMPGMSGIEATRRILEFSPTTTVLMLTISDDEEIVLDAVLAGASGYLLKTADLDEIVRGIRAVAAGQSVLGPGVAGSLLARLRRSGPDDAPPAQIADLSPRELDVLRLVVDGHDNSAIAGRLHVSTGTVKHHVSSTLVKLGVENRIQAAVLAVRLGLVGVQVASRN